MPTSIIYPHEWTTGDTQYYITVHSERNLLNLYGSVYANRHYQTSLLSTSSDITTRIESDPIQCYSYSPTEIGLFASGLLSGTVSISNIKSNPKTVIRLRPKQQRPCNSVSFNSQGLLAVALDKVRNDSSLQIFDINRVFQNDKTPSFSLMTSDVVSSAAFLRETPSSLVCGSYKFLREYDLRSGSTNFEAATKFVHGATVDPFNDYFFSTHSDSGTVAFWDRRQIRPGVSGSSEPILTINPFGESLRGKNAFPCFRISSTRRGEFAVLHDGHAIKRWQTGYVPPHIQRQTQVFNNPNSSNANLSSGSNAGNSGATNSPEPAKIAHKDVPKPGYMFVTSVMQSSTTTQERVVSFDYVNDMEYPHRLNFICLTQSGSIVRMNAVESPMAVRFDPFNTVASADRECITFFGPGSSSNLLSSSQHSEFIGLERRVSSASTQSISEDSYDSDSNEGPDSAKTSKGESAVAISTSSEASVNDHIMNKSLYHAEEVLEGDISFSIRKLAMNNYSMDCEQNLILLSAYDHPNGNRLERLRAAWKWVDRSQKSRPSMIYGMVDFSYEGVLGIWEGYNWIAKKVRNPIFNRQKFDSAVSRILERSKRKIYTAWTSPNPAKRELRQLCLRVAGWNFDISQLESWLEKLEAEGKYEQAAGWAVFHGRVNRAVQSLAASKNDRLRMMSAAIAGYDGYKTTTRNSPWKELCRKMASELENPYMRAVFAFIADGDWVDVLDETSLPLHERLGIALRFLPDEELTSYLLKLTQQVVENGDVDGIILTGITPRAVDLLQSYVDKTADVQTASLIVSFASPLYFTDERITHWVECYRNLLNSWKLFAKRSMFDVARTRASRAFDGRITTTVISPQVYLQCHNCKKVIRSMVNASAQSASGANSGGLGVSGDGIGPSSASIGGGGASPAARQESISSSPTNMMEPSSHHRYYTNQSRFQSAADTNIRCPHCNYPLPRCAVCLLPLGSMPPRMNHDNSLSALRNLVGDSDNAFQKYGERHHHHHNHHDHKSGDENDHDSSWRDSSLDKSTNQNLFDRYFVFCLSCNHGMHVGHAREWFSKHSLCAVPDCECACNQYR